MYTTISGPDTDLVSGQAGSRGHPAVGHVRNARTVDRNTFGIRTDPTSGGSADLLHLRRGHETWLAVKLALGAHAVEASHPLAVAPQATGFRFRNRLARDLCPDRNASPAVRLHLMICRNWRKPS